MRFILIVALLIFAQQLSAQQPVVGEQVQEIEMANLKGSIEKLSDLRGKIVLIDFWASWCGPCRRSNREMLPLYAKYKSKGFEIFGISIDEDAAAWKKAVAKDKITWKQVNEKGGWDASLAANWKIEEIPTSFLLDKEGRVVAVNPSHNEIAKYLKKMAK